MSRAGVKSKAYLRLNTDCHTGVSAIPVACSTDNPRILVVDDDPGITGLLKRGLMYEGFAVDTASNGTEALARVNEWKPQLVILDVMMPGIDGLEVSQRLRKISDIPILMLTAKITVADRIAGLDSGADDYLTKPFNFDELLARIRALLRRSTSGNGGEIFQFADVSLNVATREVERGDKIELSLQEFNLLELFLRHPRRVIRRDLIYEHVWGYDFEGESNVVDVYVHYLRSKLNGRDRPNLIHTVRGVGYILRE